MSPERQDSPPTPEKPREEHEDTGRLVLDNGRKPEFFANPERNGDHAIKPDRRGNADDYRGLAKFCHEYSLLSHAIEANDSAMVLTRHEASESIIQDRRIWREEPGESRGRMPQP
ncbi:protein of unknown function [Methylocaldum szegediense]|uniref:Uncharacterized protein n=2 Tax=Methylocaldum szegediense TaxID=73780 RepID=A0ABN8WZB8_9GAMM|nr:protein of unknown function [Methylocaldum szegediense]